MTLSPNLLKGYTICCVREVFRSYEALRASLGPAIAINADELVEYDQRKGI